MRVFIAGSSGFIGTNLVKKLKQQGHHVIGADIEPPKYGIVPDQFYLSDLREDVESYAMNHDDIDEAYCLACLMGGMGFIGDEEKYGYDIGVGSTEIVCNFIAAAKKNKFKKVFYSSSACVYNESLQMKNKSRPLREKDAYPAQPDLLYGWQKLFSELMFQKSGLNVRIARFHNIFGPYGTYQGGKEKAPAAMCRKVSKAIQGSGIEVWGTGRQTRSFLYIDECLEAIERLMKSEYTKPLNIGSSEAVSINKLAKMVIEISGKRLFIQNVESDKVGVSGRNSDNTLIERVLSWKPEQPLIAGLKKTYEWIDKEIHPKKVLPFQYA